MRQLLLLRHAKSSWDDSGQADHARPLNARGRQAARAMAAAMRRLHLAPELVLVSTAARTLETLHALEPFEDSTLVDPLDSLYLAPAPKMIEAVQAVPETVRSVLLIGHNPGMQDLAMLLAGSAALAQASDSEQGGNTGLRRLAERYPTCGLAEFTVAGPWWNLGAGGARLLRFLTPSDLPEFAA